MVTRTQKPPRRRDRIGWRLLFALALSLGVNGAALWIALLTGALSIGEGAKVVSPVALAPLSAAEWERNRAAAPPRPAPRPVPPPQPPERPGQLVELPPVAPPGATSERPDDARFLAERNQKVERETVSKYAQGHAGPVLPVPQQGAPGEVKPKPPAPAPAPGPKVAEARPPKGAPEPGSGPSEWRVRERGEEDGADGLAGRAAKRGQGGPPGPDRPLDLAVTPETIARIGGGPNMDGYGEVDEGEVTALNTREFKYATYMNQIRRRIGEAWYPKVNEVVRSRDPEGKSFFYKQREVRLVMVLDTSGRVSDVQVARSSNIDFFDRLAVSSVRQAQPFLNPPPGLFDPDGYVRIPFGFVLYPSERGGNLFWRPPTGE